MTKPRRSFPVLPGLPLFGNLFEFRRDRIAFLHRLANELGDIGAFRLGPNRVVIITSPELARVVLVDEADAFEKGPVIRRYSRPILGDGLIACENASHRLRRRLVAPSFQPRQVDRYASIMVDAATRAVNAWRGQMNGTGAATIDLAAEMASITLRVVGLTLFSIDLVSEAAEMSAAFADVLEDVSDRIDRPWRLPLGFPTPKNLRTRRALRRLDETIYRLIRERRESGAALPDLLSALIAARDDETGATLSDVQIRDELMTLFFAGHETSASSLAWTFILLAQRPQILAALRAEVDSVLGGASPTFRDLERLPFLLQVIKESMRLYPPVHTLGRQSSRAVRVGPHELPAGEIVIVSTYLIQRRADLYPEPERFDPARFTVEAEARLPRLAYLPFGAGPRTCVGGHFATLEAALVIATVLQRVDIAVPSAASAAPEMLVTLRPRGVVNAVVTDRREGVRE